MSLSIDQIARSSVKPSEIRNLITKLKKFLGGHYFTDQLVKKFEASLKHHGPLCRSHQRQTHPWWSALSKYNDIESSGKVISQHLDDELRHLISDAKKISTLQAEMPESVRNKFRSDLITARARDYLFEIDIAWHFHIKGYRIEWYEDRGQKRPEFHVVTPNFTFDVECKRLDIDSSRLVKRRPFLRLADALIVGLRKAGFKGSVEIIAAQNFPTNDNQLRSLATSLLGKMLSGSSKSGNATEGGVEIEFALSRADARPVTLNEIYAELQRKRPLDAYGAFVAGDLNGSPVNPIQFICRSKTPSRLLDGIYEKLKSSHGQLDLGRAGLVCCFIPEVDDFAALKEGPMAGVAHKFLVEDKRRHIAAVVFSSDDRTVDLPGASEIETQALIFRNPNCKFKEAATFGFISPDNN